MAFSVSRAAQVLGVIHLLAGCGPSAPAVSPLAGPERSVSNGYVGATFVVFPEPSPPGFIPMPPLPRGRTGRPCSSKPMRATT